MDRDREQRLLRTPSEYATGAMDGCDPKHNPREPVDVVDRSNAKDYLPGEVRAL